MANRTNGPSKRPNLLQCCGIGCVTLPVLAAIIFTIAYESTGHYRPSMLSAPVMPVPNGYLDLAAAGSALKASGGTNAMYADARTGTLSLAGEAAVVARNRAVLAQVRRAIEEPVMAPQLRSARDTMPELATFRDLARLLMADADVLASRGRYAEAVSCGVDAIQLGSEIERGGVLIHALVGTAVQTIGQRAAVDRVDRLDAAACERLADRLRCIVQNRTPVVDILLQERSYMLRSLAAMTPDELAQFVGSNEFGGEDLNAWQSGAASLTWHFARDGALHDLDAYYSATARELAKPRPQRRPVPEPRSTIAAMIVPVFDKTPETFDTVDLRNRMLLAALRMRSYFLRLGGYPSSLGALKLPAALLTDPFSMGSLIYRRNGADYLLYSVGPNMKDDGGVPLDEGSQSTGESGDLGIVRYQYDPTGKALSYRRVPHMLPPRVPPGARPPRYAGSK